MAILDSTSDLGAIIRDARIAKGWTQRDLAKRCAVAHTYITRIERSSRSASLDVIRVILSELGLSLQVVSARRPHVDAGILDDRDLRILAGFSDGETQATIARSIRATPGYTSKLASVLYLKLGAVDKAHAVAIAYDCGILEPRGGAE